MLDSHRKYPYFWKKLVITYPFLIVTVFRVSSFLLLVFTNVFNTIFNFLIFFIDGHLMLIIKFHITKERTIGRHTLQRPSRAHLGSRGLTE